MIMRAIDRSRSTGGSLGASFVLHAGLLLLLSLLAGRQALQPDTRPELTEISYIETTDGDDVVAQVREEVNAAPAARPEPPGQGVETRSAMKPAPDPAPAAQPAAAPQMEKPAPARKAPPRPEPVRRPEPKTEIAAVQAPAPAARQAPAKAPETQKLPTGKPRPATRKLQVPTADRSATATAVVAEAQAPQRAPRQQVAETFQPASAGLKRKSGTLAAGDDVLAAQTGSSRSQGLAEASDQLAAGRLQQRDTQPAYAMAGAALKPSRGRAGSSGVADVEGPTASGGSSGKGRRTILDYGSGNGGRGGSLKGKGRLAEPQSPALESDATNQAQAAPKVAEVKVEDLGSNMTISGQIKGRKILQSAPAEYSAQARRQGWEGVVAVHFTVLADGRVKDNMYFDQTSVHRDLNQAAMAAIRKFRFAPLPAGQAAVEQWGVITIVFRLN